MELFLTILKIIGYALAGWIATGVPVIFTGFVLLFNVKHKRGDKNNDRNQIVIYLLGIIVAIIEMFFIYRYFDIMNYFNLLIILLFIIALLIKVIDKTRKREKVLLIIQRIAIVLVMLVPLVFSTINGIIKYNGYLYYSRPHYGYRYSGYIDAQNSKFESYFGTDVTAQEVKNLLSEVRTNNLTASRNEESATIGVCLIINGVSTDEMHGIYQKDQTGIDTNNINKKTFDDYYFTPIPPDKDFLDNYLNGKKGYTINVPNNKIWHTKLETETGFENGDNPLGKTVKGECGVYPSGWIRLIYIIEN